MGIHKMSLIKTHFVFMSRKMVLFIRVLFWSFYSFMFTLLDFIGRHFFRLKKKLLTRKTTNFELIKAQEDDHIDENVIEEEDEGESKSFLRFQFPTFEEFVRKNDVHSISDQEIDESSDDEGNVSSSFDGVDGLLEEMEDGNEVEKTRVIDNSTSNVRKFRQGDNETRFDLSEDESLISDFDSDSIVSSNISSLRSSFIDSLSDGFLSDIDFERAFEFDSLMKFGVSELSTKDDIELENSSHCFSSESSDEDSENEDEDEDEDILQELKNLESDQNDESKLDNLAEESNFDNVNDISDTEIGINVENGEQNTDNNQNLESDLGDVNDTVGSENKQFSENSEEQNGLEKEWEHQDLVEQLKMEIKKVRAIGLPTIFEESETPKIVDDLKPWKIDEKYERVDPMDELHKFYKSYREKMRKLDILNYQKMYAIGFLKLKEPLKPFSKSKISNPAIAAIVSVDCWPCKPKTLSDIHQPVMKKFTRELESDLEMIYVAQMCLSWEFLSWEYGKALELWESDPHGFRTYNEVVERFQTFQVLLTRFMEEEAFEGPRVQHYVKNRCALRSLLQVPVVRDDSYRDRRKERKVVSSKDAVSSLQLVETIEESIRILWKFIRTDKDTSNVVLVNCRRSSSVELQCPADARLLAKVRSNLDKKHKTLKEAMVENCVRRNFESCYKEEDVNHVLYFFSRVDLKLVSRVLNMSKISTEQLIWCRDKLNKIKFAGRKLHVEPSVLLFPCS